MCINGSADPEAHGHVAVLYNSDQEYLDAIAPFVADGVRLGQPVRVAAPKHNLALLDQALGATAAGVTMVDAESGIGNPARHLPAMISFAAAAAGRPLRLVGEGLWPGRTSVEYAAWIDYEALFNTPFAETTATIGLCPYDTRQLDAHDADVLTDVYLTHPVVWQNGVQTPSGQYAPDEAQARYNRPLARPLAAATFVVTTVAELAGLRGFVAELADRCRLSANKVADVQIIATELATNSLQHANTACDLAVWRHDGYFVCEASDTGRLGDPLAGRRPPSADSVGGRGLWVVNALCDVFRIHPLPAGTTIQTYIRPDSP